MARMGNMLEPGERVLLRNTDDRLVWWETGFLILWMGSIGLSNFAELDATEARFWQTMAVLLVVPLLVLLRAWAGSIWSWVITDRRVLVREKPSAPLRALPLDAVERARFDGDILRVGGGGEILDLAVTGRFCAGARLRDLLGDRFGDPGQPVAPLAQILPAGERVRLRALPERMALNALTPLILAAGPVAIVAILFMEGRTGPASLFAIMMPILFAILLPEMVASWRRRGWWIAVTNERLFLRRWHEPGRYDIVAIGDIDWTEYDRKRARLTFHCGDRDLFLTCSKRSARRILAALGRNIEEAPT